MYRLSRPLLRIHMALPALSALNWATTILLNTSLIESMELAIKVLLVLSGVVLFFLHIKPFHNLAFYFGIYAIALVLLIVGLVFRGLPGLLIISILSFGLYPDQKEHETDGLIIATYFTGFMARCCQYKLKERKYGIFEYEWGVFESEGPIDFETLEIEQTDDGFRLSYYSENADGSKQTKRIEGSN